MNPLAETRASGPTITRGVLERVPADDVERALFSHQALVGEAVRAWPPVETTLPRGEPCELRSRHRDGDGLPFWIVTDLRLGMTTVFLAHEA